MLELLSSDLPSVAFALGSADPQSAVRTPQLDDLVILGLNHEQQHQELFITDLKFTLAQNPLFPVYREGFERREPDTGGKFIRIDEGIYEIGFNGDGFFVRQRTSRHRSI